MRTILPSSADQRGLIWTPGARSIIPGSHFHCPPLLTYQKNLGPIKGWRGHQPANRAIFLHFTLPSPSTAHFLFLSYYPISLYPTHLFFLHSPHPLIQLHTIAPFSFFSALSILHSNCPVLFFFFFVPLPTLLSPCKNSSELLAPESHTAVLEEERGFPTPSLSD